ncbi:MAG: hypothetical protein RAO92_10270 [Candidatus Euphemobacter frigidus]|nr:hypothetical protein [Candidatus Euphemobacter frigidus]MDP8276769.1 hypothetical protein [Candidatus Euphemobacter frigidus]
MVFIFDKITLVVSLILYPFRDLPPLIGIAIISLGTAVFALLVYKNFSNQAAIKLRKKRIFGHFFGIYLFRDDLGSIIRELGRVLTSIFRYLAYVLPPLLIIIVPVLLLCVQMQLRYGHWNLRPGDEVNVSLKLAPEVKILQSKIKLQVPPGLSIQTPPLRIKVRQEVDWRIAVQKFGDHTLTFTVDDTILTKNLMARDRIGRIYPATERGSFFSIIANPGEKTIPDNSPILSARIDYPTRKINLLGLHLHWAIVFLILALLFGLILKKPLRVNL